MRSCQPRAASRASTTMAPRLRTFACPRTTASRGHTLCWTGVWGCSRCPCTGAHLHKRGCHPLRRFNPGEGPAPPDPPDSGEGSDDVHQAGIKRRRLAPPPEPMPPGLCQASLSHWIRRPAAQAQLPQAPRPMARPAAPLGANHPASNQTSAGRRTSPGPTSRGKPHSSAPGLDRGPPSMSRALARPPVALPPGPRPLTLPAFPLRGRLNAVVCVRTTPVGGPRPRGPQRSKCISSILGGRLNGAAAADE